MGFAYTRRGFIAGIATAGALLGGTVLLSGCSLPLEQIRNRLINRGDGVDETRDGVDGAGAVGAKEGGTLYIASHWPYSLDPFYLQEASGIQIASCLFDPLVRYDYRTGRLVSAAARSWRTSERGTVFTFELVEGARFHNGELVTAADFKYSWERLLKPDASGSYSGNASYLLTIEGAEALKAGEADEVTGIRAIDRLTLEVTFVSPFHEFLEVLTYPAFAPVPASEAEKDPVGFEVRPTGNGAFMIPDISYWQDDALRLARFDDYHGPAPLLSAVEFAFFEAGQDGQGQGDGLTDEGELWEVAAPSPAAPSPAALHPAALGMQKVADDLPVTYEEKTYESFTYGELDVASVPIEDFADARLLYGESADGYTATPGAQTLSGSEVCTQFLLLTLKHESLTDANVRRALSYAIDRKAICEKLYLDTCLPATGIIPPDIEGFRDGAWPAATYNIGKAKQVLADAGYPEGEGLAPITLVASDTESDRVLFEMIETNLKAVGFKVKTEVVTSGERLATVLENSAALTLTGWISDFPIMESFLTPLFASFGSYNQFEYHNAAVDEGIMAARAIALKKERIEAFQAVEDLIAADMPVVPLCFTRHTLVCSDRANDLYIAPDNLIDFPKAWVSY
jgi:peptide/nickel transport system substrate-binding protein/oligopeptide transport system substrate-binding protein